MTRFYLIRHGEIPFGPGDPGLTPRGQSQAAQVGAFLQDKDVSAIFSSPLLRARQTAEIIAAVSGGGDEHGDAAPLPVIIDPRLRERMNWGDVVDQNWAEFDAEWDRASRDRDYIPLGGMSSHQAAANLAAFLSDTARQFPRDTVAVVSHGGIITDYLIDNISVDELTRIEPDWPRNQHAIITHCSITTLDYDQDGPRVEGLALVVV